ncbi:diguanylate cyclase/phosphodiesterase with PAS/PAC sensor(s) [Piscinibacter sakaiensis]|uniref:Diguanylate cyclase/phosphodiesterase with PAS/PAC sensor(S) n=1 Tax=Piscinibacter sakaiensis TaxID=1547922 RepID=A0A0K8P5V8_PISS1|nr:diguanylate cyclase/phosphodiesterase with PAS/PAC sensor(s) [Piscinibacter sakaiensis]
MLAARAAEPATPSVALAAALIDGLCDAVWLVDPDYRVLAANAAAGRLIGLPASTLLGRHVLDLLVMPEDRCFWQEVDDGGEACLDSQTLLRRIDGSTLPVLRQVQPVGWGGRCAYLVMLRDLSEQRRVENELEERLAELRATLESTADGILVIDLDGHVRTFNQTFARLWRLPPELAARPDDDELFDWMRQQVAEPLAYMRRLAQLDAAGAQATADTFGLKDGTVVERVSLPQLRRGEPVGRVFSFRDITERIEASRRIDSLAHTDALTGVANRQVLMDRLQFALARARREHAPCAVLAIDLDHFKHVNDSFGHGIGDRVLVEVAQRLTGSLREVDQVARLGSDDFTLLLNQADAATAETAARRVLGAMQRPFEVDGLRFNVTCSIGIALPLPDTDTPDDLLRRAGIALEEVKASGRGHFRFHRAADDQDGERLRSRLQLDHAMRQALPRGEFRLHYQPQVDIADGRLLGAEALIRWTDAQLGEVSPARFIPVAEESGFIVAIGDWVLRQALAQAARWYGDGADLVVSVNVSPLQFQQPGFVEGVAQVLAQAGLPGERLELELTESLLVRDAEETLQRLQALAALGVRLAIDDFGTGYSSLGYLKRFPISRLKIDRSFIKGLPGDPSDAGIVQAIVQLGRALRLEVIAEGVETDAQRAFLHGLGAQQYQGFLCAPALEVEAFNARVGLPAGAAAQWPAVRRVR